MATSVKYEDLVEAIQGALKEKPQPDGLTAAEIAGILELGIDTTRARMKTLIQQGKLSYAGKRREKNIAGQWMLVPVYQLVAQTTLTGGKGDV